MRGASLERHQTATIYLPHHVNFEATKDPAEIIKPGLRSATLDSRAVRLAIAARYMAISAQWYRENADACARRAELSHDPLVKAA